MIDFDLMVTWRRPDGTTVDLPATVCYSDDGDSIERRVEAMAHAVDANLTDFPDDLPDGSTPVTLRFAGSSA